MTFEGQYLTYAEYKNLGGSAIGLMPFNILEFEARNQIDLRTQMRLKKETNIPDKVKLCVLDLINKINSYVETTKKISENGAIASENTDGYSVSYVNASEIKSIVESKKEELEDIMLVDLFGVIVNGTPILYNGVGK